MRKVIKAGKSSQNKITASGMAGRVGIFFDLEMNIQGLISEFEGLRQRFDDGEFDEDQAYEINDAIADTRNRLKEFFITE